MRAAKRIRLGKLALDFFVDGRYRRNFLESMKDVSPAHSPEKPVSYRVDIIGLGKGDKENRRKRKWVRDFMSRYVWKSLFEDLSVPQRIDFIKALGLCGKYEKFYKTLRGMKGNYGEDFFVIAMDSRTLLMANVSKRRAVILTLRPPYWKRNRFIYSYAVYVLVNFFASTADSFVIHSSGIKLGRQACIFVGNSGAGKTTIKSIILKHLRRAQMISDDFTLIVNEKKGVYAYRVPFDKTGNFKERIAKRSFLRRMYFIKKASSPALKKMGKRDVMKEILKNHLPNKYWFKSNTKELAYNVLRSLSKCKSMRLCFPKDKSFVNILLEEM